MARAKKPAAAVDAAKVEETTKNTPVEKVTAEKPVAETVVEKIIGTGVEDIPAVSEHALKEDVSSKPEESVTAAEVIEEHYDGPLAQEEIIEKEDLAVIEKEMPSTEESLEEEEKVKDVPEDEGMDEQAETAPENESIYSFSVEKLEAYLASDKEQDKIVQESRGGNFVSSKDRVIYVPITLFK